MNRKDPIKTPPIEIASKGFRTIKSYFEQLEEDYLYEANLFIVGESGVGKTTLAKKIKNSLYDLKTEENSTKGLDIISWNFNLKDGNEFKVNIWDFGKQTLYYSLHQFFIPKRSIYILVVDTKEEANNLYYWFHNILLHKSESPLLIIFNAKENQIRKIYKSSCFGEIKESKTHENTKEILQINLNNDIEYIKKRVEQYIIDLSYIDEIPTTWIKVRKALSKDTRNYINLQEYAEICEKNGFPKESEKQLELMNYLHSLGICLYLQDDPLLKKTIILKPAWFINAIYKVLENRNIIEQLGQFHKDDLKNIWSEEKYKNMHDELLQLMTKFQFCYKIPKSDGEYIIPQLLREKKIDYEWNDKGNLYITYIYEFMPKSIILQVLGTMYEFCYEQKYIWRHGIILKKYSTKAEIIEDFDRSMITIRIKGKRQKKLFDFIMDTFEKIHKHYEKLKFDTYVSCRCKNCKRSLEKYLYKYRRIKKISARRKAYECYDSLTPHTLLLGKVNVQELRLRTTSFNHKVELFFASEYQINRIRRKYWLLDH